jgi:arylsulfatase A-like enzyme
VDDQLRQLFERLEGTGLLDNSIVIITSDHGEGLGMRWKRFGGHGGTFEEGMRVPLIIQLPGDDRPRGRIGTPVTHVDLVPTILDQCGLPPDRRLPGYSLIGEEIPSRVIFGQHSDRSVSYHGKWKVIEDGGRKNVQVYDLQADPGEVAQVPDMKEWQELQDLGLRLRADAVGRQSDWFQPGVVRAEGSADDHDAAMKALGYGGDR